MTLAQLEILTGLKQNYISRALRGKFVPRLDKLRVLAAVLKQNTRDPVHRLAYEMRVAPSLPPKKKPQLDPVRINRSKVARETGMDMGYVSKIVRGLQQPRPDDLAVLAAYFSCSMDHVIQSFGL